MKRNMTKCIDIEIKNTSTVTWQPTSNSGITIGNRWSSINGRNEICTDGYTSLKSKVLPKEIFKTNITITAPSKRGVWLLNIDLIDEGVYWFHEKGSKRNLTMVFIPD